MNRVVKSPDRVLIQNVLVSVSDKRELDVVVPALLAQPAVTLFSTGGTYTRLAEIAGSSRADRVKRVSDYTGQPEMQGGLVKTLDYKIYLGLLSEPGNDAHARDRARVAAELIDMVIVNLYPFRSVVNRTGSDFEDARGNIDIGGPCMLRAAAKSFLRVVAVCDPADYQGIADELSETGGAIGLETRFRLAQKAFGHTAQYDRAIADYLSDQSQDTLSGTYDMTGVED